MNLKPPLEVNTHTIYCSPNGDESQGHSSHLSNTKIAGSYPTLDADVCLRFPAVSCDGPIFLSKESCQAAERFVLLEIILNRNKS
jgi:hypothetical protein